MPDDIDRTAVRIHKLGEEPREIEYWQSRPPGERIAAVWPLTQSAWALKTAASSSEEPFDAESRLSRHTIRVRRRGR